MPTITKADLVEKLHFDLGLNKRESADIIEDFFSEIKNELEQGRHVKLSGFGNFILRDKPERPGRNPRTGEGTTISARRIITFKAGQKLKEHVAANQGIQLVEQKS